MERGHTDSVWAECVPRVLEKNPVPSAPVITSELPGVSDVREDFVSNSDPDEISKVAEVGEPKVTSFDMSPVKKKWFRTRERRVNQKNCFLDLFNSSIDILADALGYLADCSCSFESVDSCCVPSECASDGCSILDCSSCDCSGCDCSGCDCSGCDCSGCSF